MRPVIPIQRSEAICSWPNVLRNHWRNRRNERPPKERFAAFTVRPETQIEAASLCDSMHRCFRVATFFHVALRLDNYIRELFFCFPFRSNEDTHCITIDSLGSQLQRSNFPRVIGECFPKFLIFGSLSQFKCKKVRIDSFSCFLYEHYFFRFRDKIYHGY